ncbi:MAG: DUF6931 family protein [Succinivibrio sp.]
MADKLDWLDEHYVMLSHLKVADVVTNENYKLPFELKDTAQAYPDSEDFLKFLEKEKKFKEANTFLAYCMHRRNLAWWGYCMVLSLQAELKANPAKPRSIDDIGKPKQLNVPDWAKMPEKQDVDYDKVVDEIKDCFIKENAKGVAQLEDHLRNAGEEVLEMYKKTKKEVWAAFKEKAGMEPEEFLFQMLEKSREMFKVKDVDEENSPIFKAKRELEEKLETMRQNTLDTIKMAVPTKSEAEILALQKDAMDAAYAYIIAPDEINSKRCLDIGNTCPDTPEGLLCLVCFWSFGNLTPNTEQVVKTPAGLAANGLNSLIIMCGLAQGGERNFAKRIERYFEIGKEIGQGKNSFSQTAAVRQMPHDRLTENDAFTGLVKEEKKTVNTGSNSEPTSYVRFKG